MTEQQSTTNNKKSCLDKLNNYVPVEYILSGAVITCCIVIVIFLILIFGGIKNVSQEQYALAYNSIQKTLDDEIYTEGKYFVKIWINMFFYNKIVVPIEFNGLQCLTRNGIIITTDILFQYRLIETELFDIFWEYGKEENLVEFMRDVAEDSLRDSCGKYLASDFPDKRSAIQLDMRDSLDTAFSYSRAHAEVVFLEIENYEFPSSLNRAIDRKQNALQDINNAYNERDGKLTAAETDKLVAIIEAEGIQIEAAAEAAAVLADATAEADSIAEIWQNRQQVYTTIMNAMNMTAEEFVDEYLTGIVIHGSYNPVINLS